MDIFTVEVFVTVEIIYGKYLHAKVRLVQFLIFVSWQGLNVGYQEIIK